MSLWTYINGAVYVNVAGRTSAETRYVLETVLEHLSLVTGSERNMTVHVTPSAFYRLSSDCDEFELKTNKVTRERDGILRVREDYILTIEGALRDREFGETVREFMNWLCRMSKRVAVTDICVKVHDKCGKILTLTDPEPFAEMEEAPSGLKLDDESAWWEYLLWEKDPFSGRPLWHAYKYGNDPRIREEIERRQKWHEQYDANPTDYINE